MHEKCSHPLGMEKAETPRVPQRIFIEWISAAKNRRFVSSRPCADNRENGGDESVLHGDLAHRAFDRRAAREGIEVWVAGENVHRGARGLMLVSHCCGRGRVSNPDEMRDRAPVLSQRVPRRRSPRWPATPRHIERKDKVHSEQKCAPADDAQTCGR